MTGVGAQLAIKLRLLQTFLIPADGLGQRLRVTALRELYEAVAKVEAGAAPAFAHRVFQAAAVMQLPVAVPAETIERGGLVIGDQTGITATLFGMCQEIEGAGVVAAIERGYALTEQFVRVR